jgi:surfeit locus 1 family protein
MIRFRPLPGMTLWAVPALCVLIGLGVWQVQRLHEKEQLLMTIADRMGGPETPVNDVLSLPVPDMEWRRVRAQGHFLHDKEAYVYATEFDLGLGVHVLTPFVLDGDGGTVLVDRGFVPFSSKAPETREAGEVAGDVAVSGIVRLEGERNTFTPVTDEGQRMWYWRDVDGIARTLGVMLRAPVVIVAEQPANPGGLPKFAGYRVDIPNNHLQYALTWFGLAATLVGVYLVYHARDGRLRVS